MRPMASEDLAFCVKRIPKNLKEMMMKHGPKISIGGGFVRSCITGDKLNDIDIFTNSKDTAEILSTSMAEKFKYKSITTKNAITLLRRGSAPFQFIQRWVYEKPENILSDFDFTICCAVVWFDDCGGDGIFKGKLGGWKGLVHDKYYQDLSAKRLRYTFPEREEEAGGSVIRILKYYQKGYRVTLDSFAGTIARLVKSVDGVEFKETFLTDVLTGLLVEVDPNAITEDATLLQ